MTENGNVSLRKSPPPIRKDSHVLFFLSPRARNLEKTTSLWILCFAGHHCFNGADKSCFCPKKVTTGIGYGNMKKFPTWVSPPQALSGFPTYQVVLFFSILKYSHSLCHNIIYYIGKHHHKAQWPLPFTFKLLASNYFLASFLYASCSFLTWVFTFLYFFYWEP